MASQNPDTDNQIDAKYNRKLSRALNNDENEAATGSTKSVNLEPTVAEKKQDTPWKTSFSDDNQGILASNKKKKKSPLILIILTIFGLCAGAGMSLTPGLLIVHLKEVLTGRLDSSHFALSIQTNKMLAKKVDSIKNGFTESSDGKCGIKCKFGTISETMENNLKANKFEVTTEEGGFLGGKTLKSLKFPDGHEVKTGKDFIEALKDPARSSAFNDVFNSKVAFFLNSKFAVMLKNVFGLNKAPEITGDTQEKVKENINEDLGYKVELKDNPNIAQVKEKIDGFTGKIEKIQQIGSLACAAYGISKGISLGIKVVKIAAFAKFALMFLKIADEMKAGDNPDPAIVSQLGDQLTQVDANGNSAMDSFGMKLGLFGEVGTMSETDKTYSSTVSSDVMQKYLGKYPSIVVGGLVNGIVSSVTAGGESTIWLAKNVCKFSNSFAAAAILSCASTAGAAMIATIETGPGALAVGAATTLFCGLATVAGIWALSAALSKGLSTVIPYIIEKEIPILSSDTSGEVAGDVIYSGTAQILGGKAASYGMKAGNTADIKQYAIDTASIKQQEDAIASYDARNTPFDANNPNSFLGQIIQKTGVFSLYKSYSATSVLGSIFSIVPKSLSYIMPNTGAAADTQASLYDKRCNDPGLLSIGVDGDSLCNPTFVMSTDELNADIDTTTQYMIDNKFINEDTGEVVPSVDNVQNDYQLFLDNCANRIEPLGELTLNL